MSPVGGTEHEDEIVGKAYDARLLGRVWRFTRPHGLDQNAAELVAKTRRDDLMFLKQLIDEGKVTPLIDREYPLAEIRDAVGYAMSGQGRAKVVINVR